MKTNIIYPNGQYRHYDLVRIPADYLIKHAEEHKVTRKDIFTFIEKNLEMLKELGSDSIIPVDREYNRCGKISYRTEKLANFALNQINTKKGYKNKSKPMRYYPCGNCDMWHLTSCETF